jgi:hypothetical protein
MKLMTLIVTASAGLLMSGVALAQDVMTANVPFEFQFGGKKLPAGEYKVDTSRAAHTGIVVLRENATEETGISIGAPGGAGVIGENRPHLVFRCGESGCVLNQIWTSAAEYQYSAPKGEKTQYTASIPMNAVRGE